MKQTVHFLPTPLSLPRFRRAATSLKRLALGQALILSAGLLTVSGCGDREPLTAIDYPIQAEVEAAMAARTQGELRPEMRIDAPIDAPIHWREAAGRPKGQSRLASFANRSRKPIEWTFGGFYPQRQPAATSEQSESGILLVQAPALPAVPAGYDDEVVDENQAGPSASDLGPVEVIPTPPPRPEVKAELIPTPQGIREGMQRRDDSKSAPVARIAAEIENAKSAQAAEMEAVAAKEQVPGKPALIDPATEIGLVATQEGPEDFRKWPAPDAVLFVTGDQHGYIEPCGCTGLDKQKGGVARRFTFMNQLRDMGWSLVPVDAGNQIRRIGQQAAIKFEKSSSALTQMKYQAVGFGPDDLRLSPTDLIAHTYADSPENAMYVSANLVLLDPSLLPSHKIVRSGEWNIGLTSILDPDALEAPLGSDVTLKPIKASAEAVLKEMDSAGANFRVLTFFGDEEVAKKLMADVPGFDLIVVSGGYGEPTYQPQSIEDSKTKLIVTGNKGMFVGLVGLYQNQPMKYARVPLTDEFKDAPEMRKLMADYQQQLEQLGLSGLGLSPIPHPSGEKFIGSEACGKCHTTAFDIWEGSGHAEATAHIVEPTEGRGDVARHFDPECLSCHVTGWNPQNYYPYESGYLSLEQSSHLTGNGCENCHGPGASHAAAEAENSGVSEERKKSLRLAMQLPLEKAKEHCMECHDLDNSPDFHDDGAFEDVYWPEVEHYGLD
ncbi:Perchlorate reductase subunit gamma precursor [Stieleria maiorica]|uniref:Perchlorate reductase subunit gamma n=1 Tax=Stieleria maiorica TaxID=2795974 RepID=A0A5B9MFW8_9BACT|nr:multiheme c-type cytochrome [Stieleria maiorica]QEG00059.1 Perchlorate reductase subunit gamma precursor [Stieleria maiorica]